MLKNPFQDNSQIKKYQKWVNSINQLEDTLDFHLSLEAAFSSPDVTLQEVSALDPNTTLSAEFSLGHYLTASGKQGFGYECPA